MSLLIYFFKMCRSVPSLMLLTLTSVHGHFLTRFWVKWQNRSLYYPDLLILVEKYPIFLICFKSVLGPSTPFLRRNIPLNFFANPHFTPTFIFCWSVRIFSQSFFFCLYL
ncbi:hypothetical protein EUGRSUZ_H00008 [Eucalyptus grandis]|uniref:Uncharacterized protein n=2 Tax=Eucalyptus grandis TaxID=71139 RepID=A0ACC3JK78_EUCGR|nr:hypothetical protein EUGRSUZ_H00008 [Eucalyptus grandis]